MAVAVHTRQTSHLPCIASGGPTALNPRNYEHRMGSYFETFIRNGDVWHRRSYAASPPFAWELPVTTTGDASFPWSYVLSWRRITLLYVRGAADTWITVSDDEGLTWETPTLSIAGGVKPYGVVCPYTGTEWIAAFVTATEKIGMRRRYGGAATFEAQVNLKDSAGADLLFENDTFAFWVGYENAARLMLHAHIKGESATSTWHSADDGATWARFT